MNWKINLVLLFGRLRKPIAIGKKADVNSLRRKAERAAKLGSFLFDKKLMITDVCDVNANGVPVRIYNNSTKPNQRVMVYYHGGGFVLYGIQSHDQVCRRLCNMNDCIVVSVDYRLAPEHIYPAAHDDAYTALQWVRNNIKEYGGSGEDIVVAGDSAGGNLAACMAHRCRKENIPLKAQILIYPWIDGKLNNPSIERNGKGFLLERDTMFWFQQEYTPRVEDRLLPEISPCYETDFNGLAPALILTAGLDPLYDDGEKYFRQIKSKDIIARHENYVGLFHGFFNVPGVHPSAMKAFFDIRDFLKSV